MRILQILLVLTLLYSPFLYAEETEKGQYDLLSKSVEQKIQENKKIQIENLKVLNRGGVIYMEGVTDFYGSRYEAGKIAAEVKGVTDVDNQIAVVDSDVSDQEIQSNLLAKIRSRMKGTPFDLVSIKVSHGFVTLTGIVRDTTLKKDAFEAAIWIKGVRDVQNQIQLASIASGDERLRLAIFRRLQSEYPIYFVGKDPSIIILVESARVTLVGYVHSNVDREKIGNIIRSFRGVLSVNNQLETQ